MNNQLGRARRSGAKLALSGVSTLTFDQRMRWSRSRPGGSVAEDWLAVGQDMRTSLADVKREFKAS